MKELINNLSSDEVYHIICVLLAIIVCLASVSLFLYMNGVRYKIRKGKFVKYEEIISKLPKATRSTLN
jgi:hypothetical protein